MLVLSCRLGDRILLPGIDATVEVVLIKGKVARLGITAAPQITVRRGEVGQPIDHQTQRIGVTDGHHNLSGHD